jgi:hypothetical protein
MVKRRLSRGFQVDRARDRKAGYGLLENPFNPMDSPTNDQAIDKESRVSGADCADGWDGVTIPWNL